MKFLRSIWGAGLLLCGSAIVWAGEPRVKKQDPAVFFWYHFRTACLANNLPKLQSLTRFPFELLDPTGNPNPEKVSRGEFGDRFRHWLDEPMDSDGNTMRAVINAKEDLTDPEREGLASGEITVGIFRFRGIKGKCYWVGVERPSAGSADVPLRQGSAADITVTPVTLPPKADPPAEPTKPPTENVEPPPLETPPEALPPPESEPPPEPAPSPSPTRSDLSQPRTTAAEREDVFRFFWVAFRRAALENDLPALKELVKFPLEMKGPLEDDKPRKVQSKEFDLVWPRLMEADPHSWGPLRDSMRELIQRREEPSVEEMAAEPAGQIQVGIFVFKKARQRWRLVRAIY